MNEVNQLASDLHFVREAIEARDERHEPPPAIIICWALYVLVGYTMIDLAPRWAGLFFCIGGIGGGLVTGALSKKYAKVAGVIDRTQWRRRMLHWFVGFLIIFAAVFGLACVIPALRGIAGSQVIVVMIGILWYMAGVYGTPNERYMLWAGPALMLGGILVSLVPHYGWTALGVLIAACMLRPLLRRGRADHV
jgi:hypothetical protein